MSVSLLEVIEAGGYNLRTVEDAQWLLSKQQEFEELVEGAEDFLEEVDRIECELTEAELEAEELQAKADELRQSMREDGEAV